LVRVCEITYSAEPLLSEYIRVHDWPFEDGSAPPTEVIDKWFQLLRETFAKDQQPDPCVSVHCVAGLGRAPVLVALALMELGMRYEDAVEEIRKKRRGAINSKQLAFLASYRPKQRLKDSRASERKKKCILQ
jgi:protein tyrosine phosphatase type 4A